MPYGTTVLRDSRSGSTILQVGTEVKVETGASKGTTLTEWSSQKLYKPGPQIAALLIALGRMVGLRKCLELEKLPHQAGSYVTWLAPLLLLG